MKESISRPDAATGTTTAKNIFGYIDAEIVSLGKAENFTEVFKNTADACIEATKEGKIPCSYANWDKDGARYGMSVSLRHNNGVIKVFTTFLCDEQIDAEFMAGANMFITEYLEHRGINKSKPFMKMVKKNGVSLNEIKDLTRYMFENKQRKV